MPFTPQELFAFLALHDIRHSVIEHPPLFTVEDGREWHKKIPGLHCKNLFLKDRRDQTWLVIMPCDKRANMNAIEKRASAARLSFARPELLLEVLGLTPGSVTPFGLLNDTAKRVTVVLDEDLLASQEVNFHPLVNTASLTLATHDLLKFIKLLGRTPIIVNCEEGVALSA